jgi:uncharacterized tellurite resistance protein B-like protein
VMPVDFLKRLLQAAPAAPLPPADARSAIAAVLVMAARADDAYADAEKAMIDGLLARRYGLSAAAAAALRAEGEAAEAEALDLYQFTKAIKQAVPHEERVAVVEALWAVILADAGRDPHEDSLMRQLVDRLGLSAMDSALARQRVAGGGAAPGM